MSLSFFQTSNELCQKPYGKAIQTKALLIDFLNLHGNTLVLQKKFVSFSFSVKEILQPHFCWYI